MDGVKFGAFLEENVSDLKIIVSWLEDNLPEHKTRTAVEWFTGNCIHILK